MYHIKNDKRSKRSALKITEALYECLKDKAFTDISISELTRKAGVGRATFYRLYDNLSDILGYQCDLILDHTLENTQVGRYATKRELRIDYIQQWVENRNLLNALNISHQTNILIDMHLRRKKEMQEAFLKNYQLDGLELTQMIYMSSIITMSAIDLKEKSEDSCSAEEIYDCICRTLKNYFVEELESLD